MISGSRLLQSYEAHANTGYELTPGKVLVVGAQRDFLADGAQSVDCLQLVSQACVLQMVLVFMIVLTVKPPVLSGPGSNFQAYR